MGTSRTRRSTCTSCGRRCSRRCTRSRCACTARSRYIVMEYLEGSDLSAVIAQQKRLPIQVACDFVLQACEAIAEAHARGIIHRDLKPPNLFVTRAHDGTSLIKVLDFGISKSTAA